MSENQDLPGSTVTHPIRSRHERTFEMPPALVILGTILILAAFATFVLPKGEYQRVEKQFPNWMRYQVQPSDTLETIASSTGADALTLDRLRNVQGQPRESQPLVVGEQILVPVGGVTRTAVVAGTYQSISSDSDASWLVLLLEAIGNTARAPILGFVDKAQVIGFILLIGGAFNVIISTGAIDRGLSWGVLCMGDGKAKWAVVPISFTMFSLGGAVYGMGEDTIAFVLISVPFALRLGFDTITGVAMCYMASQVGFAAAFFNPFTVGIAQGIAELPFLSGLYFRYVVWLIVTALGACYTLWWASRVAQSPERSPTFALDQIKRSEMSHAMLADVKRPRFNELLIIALAIGGVFTSGYCVANYGWYINEMAALFVGNSILCGLIAGFTPKTIAEHFSRGSARLIEPALIISCSAGIVIVLQQGQVMDTILYGLASRLEGIAPEIAAVAMMAVQATLNFFIPSGSGQAAMTMPLISPLCDLVGLDRQIGVLAFQFGDGFGNIVIPTSAVLMGVLGASQVPWFVWVRWVFPLIVGLHILAAIILVVATRCPAQWLM